MKSAAVAAAQNQALKPSGSAAGGSNVVVAQPQDPNRPLPIASATALTSQASVLLNCLSPEQQQQHHRNVQMLQQKQFQQLQQQLQQQNLQLVAPGSGPPALHRARLGVPPPQPALDSTAAANGAGLGGAVPFSVGRMPHMIVAQNSNDALQHQQQLQLANNPPQVCADSRPLHPATAPPPVRMLSVGASRPPNPQLTLTLPSRPMHSQLAGHAIPTSGFHGDRHSQLNDQSIFTQQSSYTVTLDLPGLGHSMNDGDITPLTPQDQLSRYVERL